MMRWLAFLLLLLAGPIAAQEAPPVAKPATVRVALATELGSVVLELEKERAPVTTANFLRYVAARRFDGIAFYRAVTVAPGFGLVQAGLRDPAKWYKPIPHEPTTQTGLTHADGTISMARAAPGTATADWFIMIGASPGMDASAADPGFAAFGRVVEGMEIVRKIQQAPTDPTQGEGVMKGQMIAKPVKILTARVVE
ncbi:peptidylprolyl isomerase [Sphingomonas gilva]|uniref:peptidylprolyl isomerase n=1 Tax=Sphingomonas gilva TaxID=2305907 RepID=UPI003CCC7B0E